VYRGGVRAEVRPNRPDVQTALEPRHRPRPTVLAIAEALGSDFCEVRARQRIELLRQEGARRIRAAQGGGTGDQQRSRRLRERSAVGHLFQFTPATPAVLLTKIGFHVDRLRGIASPQNMCARVNLSGQRWLGRPSSIRPVYGTLPIVMAAALLAHLRLSCEMSAVARRVA
jgi:hypothetical protein